MLKSENTSHSLINDSRKFNESDELDKNVETLNNSTTSKLVGKISPQIVLTEESKSCESSRDSITDIFSISNRSATPSTSSNSLAKRLRDFQDCLNNTRESIQVN